MALTQWQAIITATARCKSRKARRGLERQPDSFLIDSLIDSVALRRNATTPTLTHSLCARMSIDAAPGQFACRSWLRRRSALVITDSELRLIANAANIGDNSQPVKAYNTPAARGTPIAL